MPAPPPGCGGQRQQVHVDARVAVPASVAATCARPAPPPARAHASRRSRSRGERLADGADAARIGTGASPRRTRSCGTSSGNGASAAGWRPTVGQAQLGDADRQRRCGTRRTSPWRPRSGTSSMVNRNVVPVTGSPVIGTSTVVVAPRSPARRPGPPGASVQRGHGSRRPRVRRDLRRHRVPPSATTVDAAASNGDRLGVGELDPVAGRAVDRGLVGGGVVAVDRGGRPGSAGRRAGAPTTSRSPHPRPRTAGRPAASTRSSGSWAAQAGLAVRGEGPRHRALDPAAHASRSSSSRPPARPGCRRGG